MAVTNLQTASLGGGLTMLCGTYTHTVGAAADTQVVSGKVYMVQVNPQVSSGKVDAAGSFYSVSASGYKNTVTIYNKAGVTAGTFCIIFGN
jgi:hypothetical protein